MRKKGYFDTGFFSPGAALGTVSTHLAREVPYLF